MITKERFIKELTTRIKGIKPGMPTTTDFAIDEMKSILILANALPEPEQPVEDIKREWWNKGYSEGRKNAHIPARELGLPSSWDFQPEQPASKELYEEVNRYYSDNFAYLTSDQPTLSIISNIARHFAEWQKAKMPRWYKVEQNGMLDKPTQFILAAKEGYFFCTGDYISRDGYAIFVDDLEKLPKEGEK